MRRRLRDGIRDRVSWKGRNVLFEVCEHGFEFVVLFYPLSFDLSDPLFHSEFFIIHGGEERISW